MEEAAPSPAVTLLPEPAADEDETALWSPALGVEDVAEGSPDDVDVEATTVGSVAPDESVAGALVTVGRGCVAEPALLVVTAAGSTTGADTFGSTVAGAAGCVSVPTELS